MSILSDLLPGGGIVDLAGKLIDHLVPDKTANEAAKAALVASAQTGELNEVIGQIQVNAQEAKSPSLLIAGWRPAVGWVGVVALALVYWPKAIVLTGLWSYQVYEMISGSKSVQGMVTPPFPDLGVTDLIGLLGSLLGMGSLRTLEKHQGVEGNR